MVPRPRINLLLYHGVLAPNAPWRRAVVARHDDDDVGAGGSTEPAPPVIAGEDLPADLVKRQRIRPRYRSWAELMRRAFETDVLACPSCGGRMVLLATIMDPAVIHRILTHLGLSLDNGDPSPGRAPPWVDGTSA